MIAIKRRMLNLPPTLLSDIDFEVEAYLFQKMQHMADRIKFNHIYDNRYDLEKIFKAMAMLTALVQIRNIDIQG